MSGQRREGGRKPQAWKEPSPEEGTHLSVPAEGPRVVLPKGQGDQRQEKHDTDPGPSGAPTQQGHMGCP